MSGNLYCSICLDKAEDGGVNWCSDKDHESFCKGCISSYIESTIGACVNGACPSITCPSLVHQKKKETKSLREDLWKGMISWEMLEKYNLLANSLLLLRCSSCHGTGSLDVGFSEESIVAVTELFDSDSTRSSDFQSDLAAYYSGQLNADAMYQTITAKHFAKLSVATNEEAWEIFVHILKSISDTERRVNLHLRYIRDRPKVKTICCNVDHCFRCTTRAHDGVSCLDNESNTDNAIVHCPNCNISLVKGDGCDSVACVCGHYFEWEFEKTYREYVKEFVVLYPDNSHRLCADMLCGEVGAGEFDSLPSKMARAWRQVHQVEVNAELGVWFGRKYSQCAAQCASTPNTIGLTNGYHYEAASMYACAHQEEVTQCVAKNTAAVASLFLTMYPVDSERAVAVDNIFPHNNNQRGRKSKVNRSFVAGDERMITSAQLWLDNNHPQYSTALETANKDGAKQFVYLHGNCGIQSTIHMLLKCEEPGRMLKSFMAEMLHIKRKKHSKMSRNADEWVKMNGDDISAATERFKSTEHAVVALLNYFSRTNKDKVVPDCLAALGNLSWNDLTKLLSWTVAANRKKVEKTRNVIKPSPSEWCSEEVGEEVENFMVTLFGDA